LPCDAVYQKLFNWTENAAMKETPLFKLGPVVATPGGLEAMDEFKVSAEQLLRRHQCGDWGLVNQEDVEGGSPGSRRCSP